MLTTPEPLGAVAPAQPLTAVSCPVYAAPTVASGRVARVKVSALGLIVRTTGLVAVLIGLLVSDQTWVAVFSMLASSLPQRLPIPGLDQPFDRLAETAIATAAGYATKIECAGPCFLS